MKKLFSILLLAVAVMTFSGCGDEESDPKPVVPTLPAYVGYWKFESAVVTPKNLSIPEYTISVLCDTKNKKSPEFVVEFDVTSATDATQKSCKTAANNVPLTYKATLVSNKITIVFYSGTDVQWIYTDLVVDEAAKALIGYQTYPMGDASKIKTTFKLQ